MPMEFRLELMAIIRSDFSDPEWELFYDVICKVDRIGLRIFWPSPLKVVHFKSYRFGYFELEGARYG